LRRPGEGRDDGEYVVRPVTDAVSRRAARHSCGEGAYKTAVA